MKRLEPFLTRRNALILLGALIFLIAWNREIDLLYGMFSLVCATIIIAVILPKFALKGIEATRLFPAAAFVGEEIDICVTMKNKSRATRFMVEALDIFPAASPTKRNPLVFAARLPRESSRNFIYRLECYKRGEYQAGPLTLRSAYPLGIAWSERDGDQHPRSILVYPAMFDIGSFPLLAAGAYVSSGAESMEHSGGSDDFFGTREYRQGDSLRHIHWPSTARHAQLIVKEFEVRSSTTMAVVLDLHRDSNIGEERESTLEYSVRIAASLGRYALERGHTVQLTGYGEKSTVVPPGRGVHHLPQLLDALARVKADGSSRYHETVARAAGFMQDGSTAVLFFTGREELEDFVYPLGLLSTKRVRPVVVCLDHASFLANSRKGFSVQSSVTADLVARGVPVYRVAQGDDLSEVFG